MVQPQAEQACVSTCVDFACRPASLPHLPQLVRRNEEARLLYEKVRLQQSALARGQAQYRDRLAEIRALKLKVGWGWRAPLLGDWLRWTPAAGGN